jgi:hypothetical protein
MKSLGEIIGWPSTDWKRTNDGGVVEVGWVEYHRPIHGDRLIDPLGKEPTVDELLAWLRSEPVDAFVALVVIDDGDVTVEYVHPEGFNAHAKAPTLSEALEAAVRVVAGEGAA